MDNILPWTVLFKDKEVVEYFPAFKGSDEERSTQWIKRQQSRYEENKFGLQALIDKKTNQFIGQCGLLMQEVDRETEIEVGYHIFKRFWGQGFAPEAAKLFIDYAFKNNLSNSIISIININNIRSQQVAEKNGLVREKQTNWLDLNVYIYRIKKEDWR